MNKRTGYDNANDFIVWVKQKAKDGSLVIAEEKDWPWMSNNRWREYILNELAMPSLFKSIGFVSPTSINSGWIFKATVLVQRPYNIRKLSETE